MSMPIGRLAYDHVLSIFSAFSSLGDLYKFAALNRGFYSIFLCYRAQIEFKVVQNFIGGDSWEDAKVILIFQRAVTRRMRASPTNYSPYKVEKEVPVASLKEKFALMAGELRRLVFNNFVFTRCVNAHEPTLNNSIAGPIGEYYRLAAIALKRLYIPEFDILFRTTESPLRSQFHVMALFSQNLLDMKFWLECNSWKNATISTLALKMIELKIDRYRVLPARPLKE
ncbi:hypothetical protein DFP73DRAFT_584022 [Morchella snyderi]|nr:hypothetical protein DFP73DRAFT_584022 [Morchella snyderi]